MAKCKVCQTELSADYQCPYCGYDAAVLTVSADYSSKHKERILSSIDNISVTLFEYKANLKEQSFEKTKNVSLFENNLNGKKCNSSIIKSKYWISHWNDQSKKIEIRYVFNGKQKKLNVALKPVQSEGLLYLGLHINENLRLDVSVCVEPIKKNGESKVILMNTVDLDLQPFIIS